MCEPCRPTARILLGPAARRRQPLYRFALLTRAVAIYDATLRQVVWRKLDVYTVSRKNPDAMPAQTPGDVGQDDVTVAKFDREGCAWKDLFNASYDFEGRFFNGLRGAGFDRAGLGS